MADAKRREGQTRDRTEKVFGYVEDLFYVAIASALGISGAILFGYVIYDFVSKFGGASLTTNILNLLDGLLLVFIVTELLHTVRAVIDERVLVSEPFLVVGIVAAIRRLVVVSAEAKNLVGTPEFTDAMLEIGVLSGAVLLLGGVIFLLRHTEHSEPRPAHEPR